MILLAARNWLAACPVLIDSYLLSCICFKHTHLPLTRFINACCTVQIDLQELELSFTGCDKTVAPRKATHSQADWWFLSFDVEYTPGIVSNHTRNLTVQSTFSERVCVCQYVCVLVCLSVCLSVCFCVSVCMCLCSRWLFDCDTPLPQPTFARAMATAMAESARAQATHRQRTQPHCVSSIEKKR